jgi:hypothetical protein
MLFNCLFGVGNSIEVDATRFLGDESSTRLQSEPFLGLVISMTRFLTPAAFSGLGVILRPRGKGRVWPGWLAPGVVGILGGLRFLWLGGKCCSSKSIAAV